MFAAYLRVSRVGDREHLISPDTQLERIRAFAAARGLEIAELPPELDVSGGSLERPVLDEILTGIETKRFAGIIVSQQDRLSRMGLLDTLRLIERIESAGGQFISVAEDIDGSTRSGKLTRNLFSSIAEHELDRYKEQFRVAKEQAVVRGIWPLPHTPLGYQRGTDRKLTPDPSVRVREAFEARAGGASWNEVAGILGKPLSTARRVLSNRVYLGEINYGEWVNRSAHVPLIDRHTWEAVQTPKLRVPTAHAPSLLAGLIRCAGCQGRMTPTGAFYYCQGRRKVGGRCGERASIRKDFADEVVVRTVFAHLGRVSVSAVERSHALKETEDTLNLADAELAAYQEAVRVSTLGTDSFLAGMKARIEAVEAARRKLANLRIAAPVPTDVVWSELSVRERRHVLSRSLGAVFVKRGSNRIRVIEGTYQPPAHRAPVIPLDWEADLPGELPVPSS